MCKYFIAIALWLSCLQHTHAQEIAVEIVMCDTSAAVVNDIAFCPNGDYYAVVHNRNYGINYHHRGILSKYNSAHQVLWTRYYGGSTGDGFGSINWLAPDRLLISGYALSTDGDLAGYGNSPTAGDAWLLVVDTNGNILHGNTWGYGNNTTVGKVKITTDGHIFMYVSTGGNYGDFAANNLGVNRVPALIYADTQLNKKWTKLFMNSSANSVGASGSISLIGDKALVAAQSFNDSFGIWRPTVDTGDYENAFLFLTDTLQQVTKFVYGSAGRQFFAHTLPCTDSTAYVFAIALGLGGLGAAGPLPANQQDCYMFTKVNLRNGELFGWRYYDGEFGGDLSYNGNLNVNMVQIVDSLLWVISKVSGSDTGGYFGQGTLTNRDLFITVISVADGSTVARKRFSSGCRLETPFALRTNAAGELFLTTSIGCDPNQTWQAPASCYPVYGKQARGAVYKLSLWPTSAKPQVSISPQAWQLHPNPAKGNFYITRNNSQHTGTVLLQDATGRTILRQQFEGATFVHSTAGLATGIYTVTVHSNGAKSTKQLVVE